MTLSKPVNAQQQFRFGLRHALLGLSVLAVCFAVIRIVLVTTERIRIVRAETLNAMELNDLQRALDLYKLRHGEIAPPPDVDQMCAHVARRFPHMADLRQLAQAKHRDLAQLDDREVLVFWLAGNTQDFFVNSCVCYQFTQRRLVDTDGDGWLEYVDSRGNPFRYVNEEAVIYCPETDRLISMKYIDSGAFRRNHAR